MADFILGIDTGGTFTDFILLEKDGKIKRWKVLSTPRDPSRAILEGLKELLPNFKEKPLEIVHGTTVGTNAFLERKGARTCLLITKGFEDCLFIGRQARPSLYDLMVERPPNIIERTDCLGIEERTDARGEILKALSKRELEKALNFIKEKGYEAIAISFLHSYKNPENEERLGKFLEKKGLNPCLSSRLLPEFREFERTSTTVINAYLGPIVGNYTKKLQDELKNANIFVQQSGGGCQPAREVGKVAVTTILSGPAGGVLSAIELGKALGRPDIITFDMGGTSTDVSLCPGRLLFTKDYKIEGYPINLPMIDVHTVGAGGGSIAWIDKGGLLKVGPESAGADPGPVCYGKGNRITVTDANLFLGRLKGEKFLGGRMNLFEERVEELLNELGQRLGLTPKETALGIIRLVNTNMVQAVREVSIERGYDPRRFTLMSFGGAAGLHALEVANELDIEEVIVPDFAGVFSAVGLAFSDLIFERSKSLFLKAIPGKEEKEDELISAIRELKDNIYSSYSGYIGENGGKREEIFLDVRYEGQSFELMIPYSRKWIEDFFKEHKKLYGYFLTDTPLEITSVRTRLIVERKVREKFFKEIKKGPDFQTLKDMDLGDAERTLVCLPEKDAEIPVISRKKINEATRLKGPLLITDDFTTILLLEGWNAFNYRGHLIIKRTD